MFANHRYWVPDAPHGIVTTEGSLVVAVTGTIAACLVIQLPARGSNQMRHRPHRTVLYILGPRALRRSVGLTVLAAAILTLTQLPFQPWAAAGPQLAHSSGASNLVVADADELGTDWYPNARISPAQVNSKDFAQLFDITLPAVGGVGPGQIYAQPIVADGVMLVVTESDNAYGLNPTTGAVLWSRNFGQAWQSATINCGDISPTVGITGTPVVDTATRVAYFMTDTTPSGGGALWQMQAVSVTTGKEAMNFPVAIQGSASNAPSQVFSPVYQGQRPGLAMVNGEVYAAFGSHCDESTWYGWIAGVTTGGVLHDMWVDETGDSYGAGIWGPGGIVVDSAGDLFVATGNGGTPAAGPADVAPQPPGLGECVIRLSTSGPHLQLADYFCPSDANTLNGEDGDLGSGSPTGLPASFGTQLEPDLLVEAGKSGEVYLLDRNDLGGVDQGPGGTDDVLSETGPLGGVWSHPAVWPGDGGYVYIPTASASAGGGGEGELDVYQREVNDGHVSLNWVGDGGTTPYGSSAPIVTSDGTGAGTAVVWDIFRNGSETEAATLKAFGAVPVAGTASNPAGALRVLWQHSVGNSTKFNPPVAYMGRLYVANFDGQILAFGPLRTAPPLSGAAVDAPDTVLGSTSQSTATFTSTGDVTIDHASISTSTSGASGAFKIGPLSLPRHLRSGTQIGLEITFAPQIIGGQQGTLTLTTNLGTVSVQVSGRGVPEGVPVAATPTAVNFGIQPIGGGSVGATVSFENTSRSPFNVEAVAIESGSAAPFSVGTLPDPLPTIAPSSSLSVPVEFTPPATSGDFVQTFSDHLVVTTSAGEASVPLKGSAAPPPQIAISSPRLSVGTVAIGQSAIVSFTVGNRGGTPLTITKSKPPIAHGFSAVTSLPEGTVIGAHETLVETVAFRAYRPGPTSATWVINGDDNSGPQSVAFVARGAKEQRLPSPLQYGWHLSGSADRAGKYIQLTPAAPDKAGADFFGRAIEPNGLRASFTAELSGGTGADGLSFALVSAEAVPTKPGLDGPGLGLAGLPAVAVALQSYSSSGNASRNAIGVVSSALGMKTLEWHKVVDSQTSLRNVPVQVSITVTAGAITVVIDGFTVLTASAQLPKKVYLGFTAGTGQRTDRHLVSAVQISYP